jgi:hypothetical protein
MAYWNLDIVIMIIWLHNHVLEMSMGEVGLKVSPRSL